ncbi:MAG: hypothetical protein V1919_01715 [Candidatus Omnitrophota bacterium]
MHEFKILNLKTFKSALNKEIQGYLIISPLLTKEAAHLDEELILSKIINASYIARDLKADLLGIGGYASAIADKKPMLCRHLKTPVTNGTSFTAWSVIEVLYRLSRIKKINFKESTLAIIGANSAVGSLCARKISADFKRIIFCGRKKDKLQTLEQNIAQLTPATIKIEEDANKAIQGADIIIAANAEKELTFDLANIKANAFVLNASLFLESIAKNNYRRDITVINAGVVKLPFQDVSRLNSGFPKNTVSAAMAETMLLTFEDRFYTCSLGENINLDKLEPIADLAVRHGFEIYAPQIPIL